jgi:trehalose 6-phosphate synthase
MWPVCHGFIDKANFKPQYWKSYQQVNKKYGASILEELQADDLVWIHDYHLALVPDILKKQSESVKLAFFWHIPWPDWNSFRTIPWRNEILSAMLKSDFIAFHTQSFVDNFLRCAKKLGMEVDFEEQLVFNQGHRLKVTSIPLGIDYQGFEELVASPDYRQKVAQIKDDYQTDKLVFAVDRLDYTKGIEERLDAINEFFASYPDYQGKVTFVQRIAPSRTQVAEYQQMKQQIDEKVAAINGKYQQDDWIPIKYFYGSVPQADLLPYYKAADLALITPLIDGMNLVAKEYLAVQEDGVLLLSEFAGAAEYLSNAIQINPYHTAEVAAAIFDALEMSSKAKQDRLEAAKTKLKKYDINWWRDHFIDSWLACYE